VTLAEITKWTDIILQYEMTAAALNFCLKG